jgi:hypothetical protein
MNSAAIHTLYYIIVTYILYINNFTLGIAAKYEQF